MAHVKFVLPDFCRRYASTVNPFGPQFNVQQSPLNLYHQLWHNILFSVTRRWTPTTQYISSVFQFTPSHKFRGLYGIRTHLNFLRDRQATTPKQFHNPRICFFCSEKHKTVHLVPPVVWCQTAWIPPCCQAQLYLSFQMYNLLAKQGF